MSLDELEKRLYKQDEEFTDRDRDPAPTHQKEFVNATWKPRKPEHVRDPIMTPKRTKKLLWWAMSMIALLIIVLSVLAYVLINRTGRNVSREVALDINYPREVSAGTATTWTIHYKNNSPVALDDAELNFEFPPGTLPPDAVGTAQANYRQHIDLGRIDPGEEGEESFVGVIFGEVGEKKQAKAIIEYRPAESSARYSKEATPEVTIIRSELAVSIDVPEDVQEGQQTELTLRVNSNSDIAFTNLSVGIDYPPNFEFEKATPLPLEGNHIWSVGNILPGEERKIIISGKMKTGAHEPQTFRARLGLRERFSQAWTIFSEKSETVAVNEPFLFVRTSMEGPNVSDFTNPGENVAVNIFWKNNLPVSVKNAIIEAEIVGAHVDLAQLRPDEGALDGSTQTVRWISGTSPALASLEPGEDGRISFSLPIKNIIPVNSSADRDPKAGVRVRISGEVPQGYEGTDITGTSYSEIRIASAFSLQQSGWYYDVRIPNTGPLPPKVGNETTYTIVWSLLTRTSDVRNITVSAALPAYVKWKNVVAPPGTTIEHDAASGKISWTVPLLTAGTGILRPPLEVAFQVGLTPSINQVDTEPTLISEVVAIGTDTFIGRQLTKKDGEVSTRIPNDPKVRGSERTVIK